MSHPGKALTNGRGTASGQATSYWEHVSGTFGVVHQLRVEFVVFVIVSHPHLYPRIRPLTSRTAPPKGSLNTSASTPARQPVLTKGLNAQGKQDRPVCLSSQSQHSGGGSWAVGGDNTPGTPGTTPGTPGSTPGTPASLVVGHDPAHYTTQHTTCTRSPGNSRKPPCVNDTWGEKVG